MPELVDYEAFRCDIYYGYKYVMGQTVAIDIGKINQ